MLSALASWAARRNNENEYEEPRNTSPSLGRFLALPVPYFGLLYFVLCTFPSFSPPPLPPRSAP